MTVLAPSDPIHMAGSGDRLPDPGKIVVESVAKSLPAVLQGVLISFSLLGRMSRHGGKIHKCNPGANHLLKGSFLQYRTRNCHLSGPAELYK